MRKSFLQRIGNTLDAGWHLTRETFQIMYGMYKISKLPYSCVSIFGGSRHTPGSFYANKAAELAKKLVQAEVSVLTGGGPGIMESVTCAAVKASKNVMTMGIGISGLPHEQALNKCVDKHEQLILDYFFARKWLLINYSIGFGVFPGGLGTMDELSDLLNLINTGRRKAAPIVLIGTEFWKPYIDWITTARLAGLMYQEREPVVNVTDDIDEAARRLIAYCTYCKPARKSYK